MLVYGPNHCTVLTLKGNSTYCDVRSWTLTITVLPNEPLGPRDMKQDRDSLQTRPTISTATASTQNTTAKDSEQERDEILNRENETTGPDNSIIRKTASRDSPRTGQYDEAGRESQRETASTRTQRAR